MKEIPLTRGKFALVDDEDYDFLMQWKWLTTSDGYARRDSGRKSIYMHREIMQPDSTFQVDHKDHNRLNNQRSNLRIATRSQNFMNRSHVGGSSIYKGVCWEKRRNHWRVVIKINNKQIHVGSFLSEIEAAKAYNIAAIKYFGDFCFLNLV